VEKKKEKIDSILFFLSKHYKNSRTHALVIEGNKIGLELIKRPMARVQKGVLVTLCIRKL